MSVPTHPCVLITRASHQAQGFIDACQQLGYNTTHLPCIEISATDNTPNFDAIDSADLILLTSVNAIDYAHHLRPLPWPATATGIGNVSTAWLAKLGQQQIQEAVPPFTSEGFIEQLKQGAIKKLVVIKGDGGRNVIQSACAELGIQCSTVEVYKRILPQHHRVDVDTLLASNPPTIICATSNAVLENLLTLAPQILKPQLLSLPLVVNSERGVVLAKELGFTSDVVVANPPGDEGQLQALQKIASI
ncbi:MAG: uroporphyrinogen-III synthase [Granulosicoccaceae bacterium]